MDCLVLFIGGGSLRIEHRLERWLFGILMVGAFFIVSVFGGDLVDSVVRVLNFEFETFADVARLEPPIYYDQDLAMNEMDIAAMLRS